MTPNPQSNTPPLLFTDFFFSWLSNVWVSWWQITHVGCIYATISVSKRKSPALKNKGVGSDWKWSWWSGNNKTYAWNCTFFLVITSVEQRPVLSSLGIFTENFLSVWFHCDLVGWKIEATHQMLLWLQW